MHIVIHKSLFRCLLLCAATQLTGCVNDFDDRDFFYRGWGRPKMTADDKDYFYRDKRQRSGPPEEARLPSGELQ